MGIATIPPISFAQKKNPTLFVGKRQTNKEHMAGIKRTYI
jgi:hypothetical protein